MPRKQFIADLQNACTGVSIAGVSDVAQGDDDGMFTFMCLVDGERLRISALVTDVAEYPSSHMYMIFAPDHAPESVASCLSTIAGDAFGKPIQKLMELVSRTLGAIDTDGDKHMVDSQDFDDLEDDYEQDESEEEVDNFYLEDEPTQAKYVPTLADQPVDGYDKPTSAFRARIRSDLKLAKANGFKVGHMGGLMDGLGCYVSLSCRISKLGISEEAMQAWQLEPNEYLVVIFSYPHGYKSMDSVKGYDMPTVRRKFEMRVGISTTYRPSMQEAVDAFTILSKEKEQCRDDESQSETTAAHKGFRNSFISRPLNELLRERFPQLLKYRYNGMPWNGAELFYHDHMGTNNHADLGLADQYVEPEEISNTYPSLVTADHIQESIGTHHSLPLVGMQFVLRHFVRCCEFCLICFSKMPTDLQAIKPYVCDNPLCLYQYMSLGFGPSIEHEILSQPKVVDLLVSFCYYSARCGKLKDFPTGLSLMVPPTSAHQRNFDTYGRSTFAPVTAPISPNTPNSAEIEPLKTKYNAAIGELLFDDSSVKCPFRAGDWILLHTATEPCKPLHCRILDTSLYPTVSIAEPVKLPEDPDPMNNQPYLPRQKPTKPPGAAHAEPLNEFKAASFYKYDQNFDELAEQSKREAIVALLEILPSVSDMKLYLMRKQQSSLASWVDRLPPAALGVLRWIVASNRACIMQVEADQSNRRMGQDRLCGMPGWSQFRFAMGAPDKERKFITSVRTTTQRLDLTFPTIFAWHGSPLQNWHSIIREGLHFKDTAHGRAFGHGVYHSLDCHVSLGYSGGGSGPGATWPMSELKISQALALNEVVNAPNEFVSKTPHLVVAQLDWIQTRYLLVRTGVNPNAIPTTSSTSASSANSELHPYDPIEQDKQYTPRGTGGDLIIPRSAVHGSRLPRARTFSISKYKRQKTMGSTPFDPIDIDADDDGASVATLEEDRVRIYYLVQYQN